MNGAREFAGLFNTGQYGRLFIESGSHARGSTFRIHVLPSDCEVNCRPFPEGTVEVYGVVSGQPGWTESYGWLHKGKWQEDFMAMVEVRKTFIEKQQQNIKSKKEAREVEEQVKIKATLDSY